MAREPQRREQPGPLDATLVPVQRALIARAKALEEQAGDRRSAQAAGLSTLEDPVVLDRIAAEFRTLAGELGHW
jgi:hypothetical protein